MENKQLELFPKELEKTRLSVYAIEATTRYPRCYVVCDCADDKTTYHLFLKLFNSIGEELKVKKISTAMKFSSDKKATPTFKEYWAMNMALLEAKKRFNKKTKEILAYEQNK